MPPHLTTRTNSEPPKPELESLAWCIPFLAFYAFGILASAMVTWASAKYSKQPIWPPARFREDKRLRPFYRLVLYLPALLWLPVLAVGLLSMTGCGILHIGGWLVRKLSFAPGRDGSGDETSLSRQAEDIGRVPLPPVRGVPAGATKGDIIQVQQSNKGMVMTEEAVHVHSLPAANRITRQAAGEGEEKSWESKDLENGCG